MEKTVRFGLVCGVGGGGGASSSRFPKRQRSSQQDLDESEYSEEVEEEEFPTVQRQARSQETRAADKGGGSKGNKTADPGKRSNNGPVSVTLKDPEVLDCPVCYEPLTIPVYQLQIIPCPSLTSLWSKSELPATLENIYVDRCSKLAFLSLRGNLSKALKHLYIISCSNLESIAEGLDDNTSLETMEIFICQNLKVLPDNLHKARHLRLLRINECPNLVSFPEGGLAPFRKLTTLEIFNFCIDYEKIYKPLILERGPGLHRFTSVRLLTLFGGECCGVVSFPPEKDTGKALPASLKHLSIWNFPNLERISSIENLTSFESLQLCCCPKLQKFPDNGLPTSLLRLEIYGCPLIEERIQTGDYTIPHSSAHFFPYQLIKVQIWASNKIHREERSSMGKWDVQSLITSSSDLYGPEKDLVRLQLISGRTTAFADEPSEQDDSGLRAPLVVTGLSLSNRIKLYYYCDPYELGKWASLSGV
ncbi:hypothetical protein KPL70_008134 [Citrus sinensis]|nr:hypothetical protein KPL70_008134 [Citrus sinensis]